MFVIFEGLDKSGKTTLEWEVLKATNFKHVIVDRGPAGYFAFDFVFNRIKDAKDVETHLKNLDTAYKMKDNLLVVYCKVPVDVALQRIKEHNEECPYDYRIAQLLYDGFVNDLYIEKGINVIEINTTKTIEECIKEITEKIEEVQKSEL